MRCLRCSRPVDPGSPDEAGADFCSHQCSESHRLHILDRLQELRSAEAGDDQSQVSDLLALGQWTQHSGVAPVAPVSPREPQPQGRLVTFLPVKGGSGASTTALHVAEAIARKTDERVLFIDFDLHSGTTAFRLGLDPAGSLETLLECTDVGSRRIERAAGRWGRLDILVPRKGVGAAALDFSKLDAVLDAALSRYAFVVADHPDAIYSSSAAVLNRSTAVYLVCASEIASLHLARRKRQLLDLRGALSLIVNRAGSMGSLSRSDVERVTGLPVAACLSNDYAAVRKAAWDGGLVESRSDLAGDLDALADIVIGQIASSRILPAEVSEPAAPGAHSSAVRSIPAGL